MLPDAVKTLTANTLINKFKETGISHFLVGSRAWGGATAESDFDLVVNLSSKGDAEKFFNGFGAEKVEKPGYRNETTSVYLKFNDNEINIIALTPKQYNTWKQASEMMYHAPHSVKKDRKLRRYMFTMLVDLIYLMVDE